MVEELLRSGLRIRGVLVSTALPTTPRGRALLAELTTRAIAVQEVSDREFGSAAATEAPEGVLAIAEIPARSLASAELGPRARLLVLDGIQDPGNAGTLLRTAAAFGVAVIVALPGTVDLWNAKVVRSAAGSLFDRPALSSTWEELQPFLAAHEVHVWGADPEGEPLGTSAPPDRLALVVGNEGSGLTPESRARLAHRVSIPISANVESLNVAVAAGILLYALRA